MRSSRVAQLVEAAHDRVVVGVLQTAASLFAENFSQLLNVLDGQAGDDLPHLVDALDILGSVSLQHWGLEEQTESINTRLEPDLILFAVSFILCGGQFF